MSQSERNRRLRLVVRKLNRERKRQAAKVDILCNDLVGALREFLRRLDGIGFAARFYKGLLGAMDLRTLLVRAGRLIHEELPGANVAFFVRQAEGCELHTVDRDLSAGPQDRPLEDYFTPELTAAVCKSNRLCTMDDLFGLGLDGNRKDLNGYSAATLPLNDLGRSLGFLLLSRSAAQPLSGEELDRVALIACGLSQAIRGCGAPAPSQA
jgi:hypothetical protein